jgi:hypothetical protein
VGGGGGAGHSLEFNGNAYFNPTIFGGLATHGGSTPTAKNSSNQVRGAIPSLVNSGGGGGGGSHHGTHGGAFGGTYLGTNGSTGVAILRIARSQFLQ